MIHWPLAPVGILLAGGLSGCVSQVPTLDEWAAQNLQRPVTELEALDARPQSYAARIHWQRTTYPLDNGDWIYVHPDRPDCQIHFRVDPRGIIVGYTPVGDGCRGQ